MTIKKMTLGKQEYVIPEETAPIRQLYKDVAETLPMFQETDLQKAKVELVLVYPKISKTTIARVIRASKQLKLFSDLEYIIEFSGEIWEILPQDVKAIVMEHEMRHMICVYDKNGDPKFGLVNHNLLDFREIVEKHGIDWFNDLRNKFIEVYASDAKLKEGDDPEVQVEKKDALKKKQEAILGKLKL